MTQEIEIALRKCPMIEKYLGRLIYERLTLPFPEGDRTDSIAMIDLEDANPALLEGLLERTCDTSNFDSIFSEKLGKDRAPDEKINDALAVIQAIDFLKKRDYKNIEVVTRKRKQRTVDLIAKYRNKDWAIEVKHIRGLDIKRLIPLGSGLGYAMDAGNKAIVKETLKSKINEALEQIEAFCANDNCRGYKRAVIIASRRAEFWLFTEIVPIVLSQLFESCYQGKLDKIMLLVGFYDTEIVECPCRKDIAAEEE